MTIPTQAPSQVAEASLPKEKQTTLGLYVTAREAYEMWKADPETVKILDVRTTEEYLFVGHPEMAWNIPAFLQLYEWDAARQQFPITPDPAFVSRVKEIAGPGDTILAMCRSGGRSAVAVNQLAQAGFTKVYNIVDGMEGDKVGDADSVFAGQRMKNGWKNSGLPWTDEPAPDRMSIPKAR
jgi:rhodanese-related sulfurtransferase